MLVLDQGPISNWALGYFPVGHFAVGTVLVMDRITATTLQPHIFRQLQCGYEYQVERLLFFVIVHQMKSMV